VSDQAPGPDRLSTGLPPRTHVPLAEGIIMGLNRCSPDEAFGQLRDVSRRHGIGVRVLASALVQAAMSGEAPRTPEERERAEVLALYWPLPLPGRQATPLPVQSRRRARAEDRHDVVDASTTD
jgi:ANTAR domain